MNKNFILIISIATIFSNSLFCAPVLSSSSSATTERTNTTIISKNSTTLPFASTQHTENNDSKNTCISIKSSTRRGALDVFLNASPQPVTNEAQTKFKVIFLEKGGNRIENHIDYDFVITNNREKKIFQASELAGQPGIPLHSAEGIVTIPYTFQTSGDYSVNVTVYGINFSIIRPDSAGFPIKVMSHTEVANNNINNVTTITQRQQLSGVLSYVQRQQHQQRQQYSVVGEWGNINQSQFQYPTGVDIDYVGNVYVVDARK